MKKTLFEVKNRQKRKKNFNRCTVAEISAKFFLDMEDAV
jgi:hypothetical protein